jgi:uncharacterized membrane protein
VRARALAAGLRRRATAVRGRDDGQLLLLVIAFTLIVALLITVVVNASRLFLMRRSLTALADGAAVVAANGIDEAAFYTRGGRDGTVPLDDAAAEALVRDYLEAYFRADENVDRFPGLRLVDVSTSGGVATVTLRVRVALPFVNAVSDDFARGVPVEATASARLEMRP